MEKLDQNLRAISTRRDNSKDKLDEIERLLRSSIEKRKRTETEITSIETEFDSKIGRKKMELEGHETAIARLESEQTRLTGEVQQANLEFERAKKFIDDTLKKAANDNTQMKKAG